MTGGRELPIGEFFHLVKVSDVGLSEVSIINKELRSFSQNPNVDIYCISTFLEFPKVKSGTWCT